MKRYLGLAAALSVVGCGGASAGKPETAPATALAEAPPAAPVEGQREFVSQLLLGRDMFSTYSSHGRFAVSVVHDGLALVDVDAGHVRGHLDGVSCIKGWAFSADDRFFLFGDCSDGASDIRLWDLGRNAVQEIPLHTSEAQITAQTSGHAFVVLSPTAHAIVDAWTLEVTPLDVPHDPQFWFTRFDEKGRLVVLGKRSIHYWEAGATAPVRTGLGDDLMVAADPDFDRHRIIVLLQSGRARVIDLLTSAVVLEKSVCESDPQNIYFAPDRRNVLLQCGRSVLQLDAKLGSPQELVRDDDHKLIVELFGSSLMVHRVNVGVQVYDLDTHRAGLVTPIHQPAFLDADRIAEWSGSAVFETATGRAVWTPMQTAPGVLRGLSTTTAAFDGGKAINLRSGATFRADAINPAGVVTLTFDAIAGNPARKRVTVRHRDSDASWTKEIESRSGAFLADSGDSFVEQRRDIRGDFSGVLVVHDARSAHELEHAGTPVLGPGDRMVVDVEGPNGPRCHLHALATGADVLLEGPCGSAKKPSFAGSDRIVVDEERFLDASTGKVAWALDGKDHLYGSGPDSDVVVVGASPAGAPKHPPLRLLTARDGKLVGTIEGGGDVLSLEGRSVLVEREGVLVVTNGVKEVALPPFRTLPVNARLSADAAFVWYQRPDTTIAAVRVADGRTLVLSLDAAPFTDEWVFDPLDSARVPLMVRAGSNLLASVLEPITSVADRYGHPDLLRDFFAGAPVSPLPGR